MKPQITILGATGFVGKVLVKQALQEGYRVKVLVRSKKALENLKAEIEIIEGEYFSPQKVEEAIEGSIAVLSTIGPPLTDKNVDVSKYHLAMENLIQSIEKHGIRKFINIAGAGVKFPNEQLSFRRKALRLLLKLIGKNIVLVKDEELELLYNSNINFVSVRPPMIKHKTGEYKISENDFVSMKIGVEQISKFMLSSIEENTWNRKAPLIG